MPSVGELLQLTRKDMAGFPETSIKYVLELQKKDWKATRSNRSHIAVMSPDGAHRFGLSQKEGGLAYLKRDVRKYYAARGEEENKVVEKKVTTKFPCPRPECNKVYASLEHLDTHIAIDHEKRVACAEPGCRETFKSKQVMGRHRQVKHGYQSPRYKERKAQEARRAQKKAEEEIAESREETADTNAMIDYLKADAEDAAGIKPDLTVSTDVLQHYTEMGMKPPQIGGSVGTPTSLLMEDPNFVTMSEEEILQKAKEFGIEDPNILRTLTEGNEFYDKRESWTLDLQDLLRYEYKVEDVVTMMAAAGLGLEIRVWKI